METKEKDMYNLKTYKNGLRLFVNEDNSTETVSVIFCVLAGGKDEDETNRGVAHLAEHMFFKGTTNRTGKEIIFEFDKLGIQYNAFTSQDLTCFYADAMQDKTERIFDIYSDCLFNTNYPNEELKTEKQAVCSEQEMYIDDSKSYVETKAMELALNGTPYQYVLGGTVEQVNKLTAQDLTKFRDKYYTPNRLIISVCGKIKQADIEKWVEKYILPKCSNEENQPLVYYELDKKIDLKKKYSFVSRDTDQYYCCVGFKPLSKCNPDYLKYRAAVVALGGNMSSRLFQKLRYEKGLAYVVGAFLFDLVLGFNGIVFYTNINKAKQTVELLAKVMQELRQTGFTQEELEIAKNSIKSSYALSLITPYAKTHFGARSLMYHNKIFDLQETLDKVDKITLDDLNEVIRQNFKIEDMTVSVVSNKENFDAYKILSRK